MKKNNRKNVILALAFASVISAGVAFGVNGVSASADSDNFFVAGASVQYVQEGSQDNGIRFAVAVKGNESEGGFFQELSTGSDFKENVEIGGLVAPSDLFTGELTTETVLDDEQMYKNITFEYSDFIEGQNEQAGYMVAFVTLYNFSENNYNRDFTVRAYYEIDGEKTYCDAQTSSMSQVALDAMALDSANADKLKAYIRQYKVSYYLDGVVANEFSSVKYGDKIDVTELPTDATGAGRYVWYADAEYQTEFDFDQVIKGSTKVYGKYVSTMDKTLNNFTKMTSDYSATTANDVLTLNQQATTTEKDGLATFNVQPGEDFYIKFTVTFDKDPATAAQGVGDSVDNRVGLAYINPTNNENYRFMWRSTQCALIYYNKSTSIYEKRSGNAFEESQGAVTYVYGKNNSTPKEPKLVLQNTASINNFQGGRSLTFEYKKVGNKFSVWLKGELWQEFTLEENFQGVPTLLSYTLDGSTRAYSYSNIVIKTGVEVNPFSSLTSDFVVNGNGTYTQSIPTTAENGLAKFNVAAGADFEISMDVKLSTNVGTLMQSFGTGAMAQVGLAYINETTNENYRYMLRGTWCALVNYDKSTTLYDVADKGKAAEGKNVIYLVGPTNSNPTTANPVWTADKWSTMEGDTFKVLDTISGGINGSPNFTLKYVKVGNQMSVYVNNYLVNTYTLEANFQGVPALLAYSIDGNTRTHTYSNIVVKTGSAVTA